MARRFRGEGLHKVDQKGRVSIPAPFRRVLETCDPDWAEGKCPSIVIVYGHERQKFLECFTVDAITEVDEQIAKMPRGSRDRRALERMFSGQAIHTAVDETGRLVLPAKVRNKINIQGEAFFIASGDTFQIWKPETYDQELAGADAWLDEQPDDFDPLTLLPSFSD